MAHELKCDGATTDGTRCAAAVAFIDEKGFIYCAAHGRQRALYRRCRKLKPAELKTLQRGEPIAKY